MPSDRFQRQSFGGAHNVIKQSRVLLVGAGGIGCELLKNLVKTGFGEVHIIDLDTIDLSNLNRQFLFRQEHIKKPKSIVAKEVAQRFNPDVKLVAYHANIKDAQFNIEWFSSFTLVFNALDNLEARRHVNRMCLAADVPLIESGTTGFKGQVQVIRKGKTACYDCSPKTTPKSFPVCTIRSTPSEPIHCIVWAKSYLLPELFGVSEDEVKELDTTSNSENVDEIKKLKEEAEALKKIRGSMGSADFAQLVFDKVFKEDIERLAKMEDMWKKKKAPVPLSYETLLKQEVGINAAIAKVDQQVWTVPETFVVFKKSLARLALRLLDQRAQVKGENVPEPLITFDKDDDDTLEFVTAAANLRSAIFSIESKSKFDVKQMAGNIIPAIASTNAMVASLCVLQAQKVVKGDYGRTKMIFVDRGNISSGPSDPPNPDCTVCGIAMSRLQIDPDRATLEDLVKGVLQLELGYGKEITVLNSHGGLLFDYIDEEDNEDEAVNNMTKRLTNLNVSEGTYLLVMDDEGETPRVDLQLNIEVKKTDGADAKPVTLIKAGDEAIEIPRKARKTNSDDTALPGAEIKAEETTNGTLTDGVAKRKRGADEADLQDSANPSKKTQKAAIPAGGKDTPLVIDDVEDGPIDIS